MLREKPEFPPLLYAFVLAILLLPPTAASQGIAGGGAGEGAGRIEGRYKLVPLPFVTYNRSIGLTLGALPMVMFNPVARDTISPSSVAGMLGLYSTNGTWFGVGFAQMFFAEDRWRLLGAGGTGSGLATVFEGINEADDGKILPGIGAGLRFTAFTDNHMNIGLDSAAGDGDWGMYFRIGEAF